MLDEPYVLYQQVRTYMYQFDITSFFMGTDVLGDNENLIVFMLWSLHKHFVKVVPHVMLVACVCTHCKFMNLLLLYTYCGAA